MGKGPANFTSPVGGRELAAAQADRTSAGGTAGDEGYRALTADGRPRATRPGARAAHPGARAIRILEPISLAMVPAVLCFCAATGSDQSALLTLFAALCAIAVFFTGFEVSRPSLRQIMPTVVLGAIAAAGRIVFAPIADFKPVSAICILAGATLGRRSGFMVGALAALVSNFFFGQGAWTPWQMYAWGLIGYLAGVLAPLDAFEKTPVLLTFGFLSAMLYGLILNGWYIVGFIRPITLPSVVAAYAAGFPYDVIHGVATVVFLSVLYVPWRRKLDRIKRKFDLLIR